MPVLEDVKKHFKEKIKIIKIDIDQHADLSKSLMILSVPTLILFVEQKEVWRLKGFDTSSVLIKAIDKYVAL